MSLLSRVEIDKLMMSQQKQTEGMTMREAPGAFCSVSIWKEKRMGPALTGMD